jgi:serine/threonine-protein kinase
VEQHVRFCTTSDGVRIAYAVTGQGPPLVRVLGWFTHLEHEWKNPLWRGMIDGLSASHMYIRYDGRGMGLSDREVTDFTPEAHLLDLEAVIDALGLEKVALEGLSQGGPTAIAYAVRYPERISHLILYGSFAKPRLASLDTDSAIGREQFDAMVTLIRHGWGKNVPAFRLLFTGLFMPEGDAEAIHQFNELGRVSTSAENAAALFSSMRYIDVTDLLPQVRVPTLVAHVRGDAIVPFELGRELATGIPGARLLALEGNNHAILPHEPAVAVMGEAVNDFLAESPEPEEKKPTPTAFHAEAIGRTISHYRIIEQIGEGGMGVVYKAEDTKLSRSVALKFLPPELTAEAAAKERFLREAHAAAALDHPNICTTYEIDDIDGQTFIAMAYIDGQDLSDKIESGSLDVGEAVQIAIQAAEGLQEAHKKGIVHRDIKSANIMLSESGRVRVMDFGLAKLSGKTRLTKTATIMGTVNYMSPEQARGGVIDHRTDIWSLGVVLYEMLSGGMPPFDAESDAALLHNIIYEEPEPLANHRKDVPPALLRIIKKMMYKDPADRYQDMGALIADLRSSRSEPAAIADVESVPSIAVLPFADMSPGKDQEYFCDGLSEELINALTQIKGMKVIARTSAFSFKGQNVDVRDIGSKLGVGTVLEGSLRKAGDKLRIMAQLIDVTDGRHIWSQRYDRELDDVFAIQDEITAAIVDRLKAELLGEEEAPIGKRKAVDMEAYDLYLKGMWYCGKRTAESLKEAMVYFEQAIEKDPNYAAAYAGLADSYISLPLYGGIDPKTTYPKAREAALRALEIDDTLAQAHTALGMNQMLYDWDWKNAEKEYRRAIELNPGLSSAHNFYAIYLSYMSRFDEAIDEIERARDLDPLSPHINRNIANMLLLSGQHDRAIEQARVTIEMDPNFSGIHLILGLAYSHKSMFEEAMAEHEKERAVSPGMSFLIDCCIGIAYVRMGKKDEALEVLDTLLERAEQGYVPSYFLAMFYFTLENRDKGFEWLEQAYQERDSWIVHIKTNDAFEGVRSDPRFIEILRKMGFDE